MKAKSDRKFLDRMLKKHADALEGVISAYTRKVDKHVPIHPEYVASVLDELADEDAVFTVDTGMCNVWAARYLTPNGKRRVIGSFSHGSMANALPQAIGAQFTDRNRQVVSMSGDGGFTMLMGDFLTLVQYDLPVKVVLFNNSSLGMVELEMLVAGLPSFGTTNKNPDFAAVARASGAYGVRVEKPKQLEGALKDAFKHKGPALVDIVTDPNALSIPPKISADMVTGFALSMRQDRAGRRRGQDGADGPVQPAQRAPSVDRRSSASDRASRKVFDALLAATEQCDILLPCSRDSLWMWSWSVPEWSVPPARTTPPGPDLSSRWWTADRSPSGTTGAGRATSWSPTRCPARSWILRSCPPHSGVSWPKCCPTRSSSSRRAAWSSRRAPSRWPP